MRKVVVVKRDLHPAVLTDVFGLFHSSEEFLAFEFDEVVVLVGGLFRAPGLFGGDGLRDGGLVVVVIVVACRFNARFVDVLRAA